MMNGFLNAIRSQANLGTSLRTFSLLGYITGYDPNSNFLVTVQIYPADSDEQALQTGYIPLLTPWAGDGWGLFAPPSIGDIVEVTFQEGNLQSAFATLRAFPLQSNPQNVPSGEFWLIHKSGSYIKLTNDGDISIHSSSTLNITSDTEIDLTAPTVKITASNEVKIDSPSTQIGELTLGTLLPVLKSDDSPSVNVEVT